MNELWVVVIGGLIGVVVCVLFLIYLNWDANRQRKYRLMERQLSYIEHDLLTTYKTIHGLILDAKQSDPDQIGASFGISSYVRIADTFHLDPVLNTLQDERLKDLLDQYYNVCVTVLENLDIIFGAEDTETRLAMTIMNANLEVSASQLLDNCLTRLEELSLAIK